MKRPRPGVQATFAGEDLYPDLEAKAAALLHSLVANHPFVDGNKRIGAAVAELFLTSMERTCWPGTTRSSRSPLRRRAAR